MIARLIKDEDGQATTEYALIAATVVVGALVAAGVLRNLQGRAYDNQHQALREWQAP